MGVVSVHRSRGEWNEILQKETTVDIKIDVLLILIGYFVLSACWELHSAGHFVLRTTTSAPGVNQGVWENSNSFKPSVSLGLQLSSCKKTHVKFVRRDIIPLQEECWALLFYRGLPVYLLCYRFQIKFMCATVDTSDSSSGFIPPGNPLYLFCYRFQPDL